MSLFSLYKWGSQLQELPRSLWVRGFRFMLPEESCVSGAWGMGTAASGGTAPRWEGLVLLVFAIFKTENEILHRNFKVDFLWEMITKWKVLNLVSDMPIVVILFCTHYLFCFRGANQNWTLFFVAKNSCLFPALYFNGVEGCVGQVYFLVGQALGTPEIPTVFIFYLCHIYLKFYTCGFFNHQRSTIKLLQQVEIATPLPNRNFCIARHLSSW